VPRQPAANPLRTAKSARSNIPAEVLLPAVRRHVKGAPSSVGTRASTEPSSTGAIASPSRALRHPPDRRLGLTKKRPVCAQAESTERLITTLMLPIAFERLARQASDDRKDEARSPYTTHNREVGGSNPPGAIEFSSGMRFPCRTGGASPRSLCREVIDRSLWALQSAIGLGHGPRIALRRPPRVHNRSPLAAKRGLGRPVTGEDCR
jgi:hypothetical protein